MLKNRISSIAKSRIVKILAFSIIIGSSLGGSYILGMKQGQGMPATYKYYPKNGTLVTIGKETVKTDVLKKQMSILFASQHSKKFTADEIAQNEQMFIDYTITSKSLEQKAIKEGLKVSDDEVDSKYKEMVPQLEGLLKISIDEIFKKFDLSEEYIKDAMRTELLGNAYLDKIGVVSEEEAKKYYKENPKDFVKVEASHILIKTVDDDLNPLPEDKIKEAKKRAEEVLDKVKKGEDFASLAKEYSEDSSASEGGSLGTFGKGEMVEEFEKAVFALKDGEFTKELVKTEFGYHIIKKKGEFVQPEKDALASIKDTLAYNKKYKIMSDILKSPDVKIKYEI